MTNPKAKLQQLEQDSSNKKGKELKLISPHKIGEVSKNHVRYQDEGWLICEVTVNSSGHCEVKKINSRLSLFSISQSSANDHLAQVAINTTKMWFDSESEVVATGLVQVIEEKENYGLYKVKIQTQYWGK